MKSEKYLNRIFKPMSLIQNKVKAYDRDMVNKAIKIAEQEAEERMLEKAIEAHRKVCFFRNLKDNTCANTATQCGEHSCYYMNYLIQELTEQ